MSILQFMKGSSSSETLLSVVVQFNAGFVHKYKIVKTSIPRTNTAFCLCLHLKSLDNTYLAVVNARPS